jgi:uncharacterized repeat protein (TIGR03803 family)
MPEKCLSFRAALAALSILLVVTTMARASSPKEHTLYSFGVSEQSLGGAPFELDGLVADQSGNFYGTARQGGTLGYGVVFEMTPPAVAGGAWTQAVIYNFQNGSDGNLPMGGLIFDKAGNLYGTTAYGGSAKGNGSVFELSPPSVAGGAWIETTLHDFQGGNDGAVPDCGVISDSNGNLYGTTDSGGASDAGTVFELSPPSMPGGAWSEAVLYAFPSVNGTYPRGAFPVGGLLRNPEGALFGTTSYGGPSNDGVVFKLEPPLAGQSTWREAILYSFTGGSDGSNPNGDLALGANGGFYGVTAQWGGFNGFGYGTVYQMTPPAPSGGSWTETTVYTFTSGGAWDNPVNIMPHGGALYGTTGGPAGTVFELTSQAGTWTETDLHVFDWTDGNYPVARLTFSKGRFYGTTLGGGAYDQGVFFEVIP